MTRWKRAAVTLGLVLVGTFLLTRFWYHALICIPFSERLWTLYNRLYAGTRPDIAYDLEFLTVLAGAVAISYGVVRLVASLRLRLRKPK